MLSTRSIFVLAALAAACPNKGTSPAPAPATEPTTTQAAPPAAETPAPEPDPVAEVPAAPPTAEQRHAMLTDKARAAHAVAAN